jgi:hypothetical protein
MEFRAHFYTSRAKRFYRSLFCGFSQGDVVLDLR